MTRQARAPRRRGKAWVALGRGVHRPADLDDAEVFAAGLLAWQEKLPTTAAFTGLTAARLHGLWLLPLPADLPVFVAIPKTTARPRRPELRVTRHSLAPPSTTLGGVRVATVAETLLACAVDLGVLDLVVLIDGALHLGKVTRAEVETAARERRRGSVSLRAALLWVDGRSESPWESVLRMFHAAVGAAVVPQVDLRDAGGAFVARADLLLTHTRDVHEYDGVGHRDARQHRDDLRRERRLLAAGYRRRGYTAADLGARPLELLRDIDAALGRAHDPRRLEAWMRWWNASLFSDAGRRFDRVGPDPWAGQPTAPLGEPPEWSLVPPDPPPGWPN